MTISILTLFPDMFTGPFDYSIVKRAQEKKLVHINFINIRDFATNNYKTVDDRPYGGGIGMILKVDIIDKALEFAKSKYPKLKTKTILLDPRGTTYHQSLAQQLTTFEHVILIAGHYEDVDARVYQLVDEVISVGNYILTGGEIPAMTIVDSVVRLIPGVLEKPEAPRDESFVKNELASPQYTRPEEYKGMSVPKVLTSGDHKKISDWKKTEVKRLPRTILSQIK